MPDERMVDAATLHLKLADPVMAGIIERVGPYVAVQLDPSFKTLARSVTFQQLHGKAATVIFERLRKAAGGRLTASAFLKLPVGQLQECGLSRQKIESLTDLAERVIRREIQFNRISELGDQEVIEVLSKVRGIGVWTAQMFLMFALQRPNVLPVADFGIRNAVRKAYGLPDLPKAAELLEIASKWHPYCTAASWYLWRSLDGPAAL